MADIRTIVQINDASELLLPLMRDGIPTLRIGETYHGHAVDLVVNAGALSPAEQISFLLALRQAADELANLVARRAEEVPF